MNNLSLSKRPLNEAAKHGQGKLSSALASALAASGRSNKHIPRHKWGQGVKTWFMIGA